MSRKKYITLHTISISFQSPTFRLITATVIVADGRPWIPSLTAIPDVQYSAMTTSEPVHQATHDCTYQCLQHTIFFIINLDVLVQYSMISHSHAIAIYCTSTIVDVPISFFKSSSPGWSKWLKRNLSF